MPVSGWSRPILMLPPDAAAAGLALAEPLEAGLAATLAEALPAGFAAAELAGGIADAGAPGEALGPAAPPPQAAEPHHKPMSVSARDWQEFPGYYEAGLGGFGRFGARIPGLSGDVVYCTAPLEYIGRANVEADIRNLKAAIQGKSIADAYLPA